MRTSASTVTPLWNRQQEWQRRLAMVHDATRFLYQSIFYIEYDEYGREMLDALLEAQRRGVAVQLIIDQFGQRLGGVLMNARTRAAMAQSLDALRQAGAVVTTYRPPRRLQRWMGGGHHVKIQVSDAGEAIFSSGNITASSFEGWNEYALALRGAVVPVLLESCRAIGGRVDGAHVDHLRALVAGTPESGDDVALDYWFCNPNVHQGPWAALGWRGANLVTDRMVAMVDAATRSLVITSFYFKPTAVLMAAVLRAARRGVRVEVHHSHRDALPATDLAWIASAVTYPQLLDAGVAIFENRRGEHSKIVLVDDAWVSCGSYNFEDAAHDRLAEAMVASRDARMVEPARRIIDELRRDPDNDHVTVESLRAWPERTRRRVAWLGRFKRWM